MSAPLIELIDVTKTFHQGRPNAYTALRGIRLGLEAEKLTVIQGPSGSGKTSLLSLIGAMSRPTTGRIRLRDRELTSLPERFLTEVRRSTFGFIFQHFNLVRGLSALDNVMLPALPSGRRAAEVRRRAGELLALFDVAHRAAADVVHLSGGESRRVTIARALVNDPEIVIADEPTAHLDTRLAREFMGLLGRLKAEGKTVLVASHDPLVVDWPDVDRVVRLRDGLIEPGTP